MVQGSLGVGVQGDFHCGCDVVLSVFSGQVMFLDNGMISRNFLKDLFMGSFRKGVESCAGIRVCFEDSVFLGEEFFTAMSILHRRLWVCDINYDCLGQIAKVSIDQ